MHFKVIKITLKKLAKIYVDKMKAILIEDILDKYFLEEVEQSDIDNIDYIKTLDRYEELLDEWLIHHDVSGLSICEQSSFLDPKNKFNFSEYNEEECENFRNYLAIEYGIKKNFIE